MAEGYSHNPDEEKPKTTDEVDPLVVKKPDAADRFKNFIGELFRPKESKEKEEDEESEKKKSRFSRLWRSLFPSVASKEDIVGDNTEVPRQGLFFETTKNEPMPEQTDEQIVEVPSEQSETLPVVEPTEPTEPTPPPSPEAAERSQVNTEADVRAVVVEAAPSPSVNAAPERTEVHPNEPIHTNTETVVVGDLASAERNRIRNIERREQNIERIVPPVIIKTRPEKLNILNPKYETIKTPEVVKQFKEVTVERQSPPERIREPFKEVEKQAIIEKILKTDTKEVDEHKEISYELSHEHKDMDKQTAGAWAVMQANADAQAKANAAAIAAAQNLAQDSSLVVDDTSLKTQDEQSSIYKKAAVSGFVSAVVIIAIIIVIILIQSN